MIRQFAITISLLSACVVGGYAQEDKGKLTDPIEILKRADSASKAVKIAQYEARSFALDAEKNAQPIGKGKAVITGFSGRGPEKFNIIGTFRRAGSEDEQRLTAGTDTKNFFLIDHKAKKAYVDIDPAVTGPRGQLVSTIIMLEYGHAAPFTDELNGTQQKLVGVTQVGDQECYEVFVQYASVNQSAHWFFSTKDFLPRRVDRLFGGGEGRPVRGTRLVVTLLTTDPKLDGDPFKFKLPDGFEQVDDFAP